MVLKQKIIFLRGWKSASLEAFAASLRCLKNVVIHYVISNLITFKCIVSAQSYLRIYGAEKNSGNCKNRILSKIAKNKDIFLIVQGCRKSIRYPTLSMEGQLKLRLLSL